MKKILTRALYLAPLFFVSRGHAQGVSIDFPTSFAGFSSQDLKTTIENIIRIVLGFLGILTVIIILYGGFIWMTSFGEEDKIDQAKKLISAGVVGLVVVLAAYAISSFVIDSLVGAV
ncbi:MAG: hypothetical protein HY422_00575 [Candidatus Komeilibacteria bacterium]|nr:hypothetical protein [Candidatus Komeilibacteria bacterium]